MRTYFLTPGLSSQGSRTPPPLFYKASPVLPHVKGYKLDVSTLVLSVLVRKDIFIQLNCFIACYRCSISINFQYYSTICRIASLNIFWLLDMGRKRLKKAILDLIQRLNPIQKMYAYSFNPGKLIYEGLGPYFRRGKKKKKKIPYYIRD